MRSHGVVRGGIIVPVIIPPVVDVLVVPVVEVVLVAALGRKWPGDQIVGKRADAIFLGLRLISGTIEGHAQRGVLSTGAGEAQEGCKVES